MKAIRLVEIGKHLQLQEVPVPDVDRKEVLIRIMAAGICHSDVHYRAGTSPVGPLPQTIGHEIAGVVEEVGSQVAGVRKGDRVCLHYLLTCGDCEYCRRGQEQFCTQGRMIGKHCDGGFAEYIAVPVRNLVPLPEAIPFEQGAILMCSAATSFHALRKSRLQAGESVAVFGAGGLGMSAIQLAYACGARKVLAVDIHETKLKLAEGFGAIPVDASKSDPVKEIQRLTDGKGVDVALELIGLPKTMEQATQALGILGRVVLAGITDESFQVDSYVELLGKEAEIIGSCDHFINELSTLTEFVLNGRLDLSNVITERVPLDTDAINQTLDTLERFGSLVRTVIIQGE